ncbi:MAG: WD40/YVTN/BNR-like repeat-containing protein, partial [Pirellulales bacterium]
MIRRHHKRPRKLRSRPGNAVMRGARRLLVEPLEQRQLLAVWVPQGPSPSLFGQVESIRPDNPVAGAVHTLVAHPTDADILYAGGVNGGVWRTDNATSDNPVWDPLTDDLPSLSIGALTMDPADPDRLLAGTGVYSSFSNGGGLTGLYLTENGGQTWEVIDDPLLVGRNFSGVELRGDVMLASSGGPLGSPFMTNRREGGLFRSEDGGATWTSIEVVPRDLNNPDLSVSFEVHDLVGDPTNPDRFYAAVQDQGIFVSSNGGENWRIISQDDGLINGIITEPGGGSDPRPGWGCGLGR